MSARDQLRAIAEELEISSLAMSIQALAQGRRAAKLDQLADWMTDDQADRCLGELVKEGLVVIMNGKAKLGAEGAKNAESQTFPSTGGSA